MTTQKFDSRDSRKILQEKISVNSFLSYFLQALASETFVDERNSKRRLEVNEAEKSNLKLQLDLASEKIDLLESQLQDKSNELKQCKQDNTDLKRIIDYQSNSIENLSSHTNDMNLILSSMKSICGKDEKKVSQLKVQQTKCIQNRYVFMQYAFMYVICIYTIDSTIFISNYRVRHPNCTPPCVLLQGCNFGCRTL